MELTITFEYESETERWIAELEGIPGVLPVLAYGQTKNEAVRKAQAAALWYLSGKLENGEIEQIPALTFAIAA